jgi:hypothetical protein
MRIFVLFDLWRRAKEKMQAVARRAATEERAKMLHVVEYGATFQLRQPVDGH